MRIVPEPPFDMYYVGHVRLDHGRRHIHFRKLTGERSGTSYARYIYQVDLWAREKKLIPPGYEVHHRDKNPLNDSLDNLRLLSEEDHRYEHYGQLCRSSNVYVVMCCPICKIKFLTMVKYSYLNTSNPDRMTCCTRRCGDRLRHANLPKELIQWIRHNQIIRFVRRDESCNYPRFIMNDTDSDIGQVISDKMFNKDVNDLLIPYICADNEFHYYSFEGKLNFIECRLNAGISMIEIGNLLNIDSTCISDFVRRYLPKYSMDEHIRLKVVKIKEYLDSGMTMLKVADVMGMSSGGISYLVLLYLPEYSRAARLQRNIDGMLYYRDLGYSHSKIAQAVGLTPAYVSNTLRRLK